MQLSLATIVGMPLIAVIIDRFSETVNLAQALVGAQPMWQQLAQGLLLGAAVALGAHFIISRPFMQKVNSKYVHILGSFELSWSEILFISTCAGIGEEMLFRGALQPLLGIAFTSVLFVAIHGYLNPRDWRISVYGIYMSVAICFIGILAQWSGLPGAILAHAVIDVYLLRLLMLRHQAQPPATEQTSNPPESHE